MIFLSKVKKTSSGLWSLIRENRLLFGVFALFALVGGAGLLTFEQGDLVLFFSEHRSAWGDLFFRWVTNLGEGYFFVIALVLLLFTSYRYAAVLPLLGLSVSVVSYLSKEIFSHPRPWAFFRDQHMLDQLVPVAGVHIHEGPTSFPSGHTMAAFALYFFLALCLRSHKRGGALILFLTALAVGLSRVYLLQHFFKDIYFGAFLGAGLAVLWYWMAQRLWPSPHPRMDSSLQAFRKDATVEDTSI